MSAFGQTPEEALRDSLHKRELILQQISDSMIDGSSQLVRMKAVMKFIPVFSRALKIKGSMDYPFDSLKFMKKFTADDKSFRLYNWLLKFDDNTFHYFGALQYYRNDSLKVLPFRDATKKMDTTFEIISLGVNEWMGALYYQMVPFKVKKQKYYMLLGWDGFNKLSNKKIIDIFYIDRKTKQPHFGAPLLKWNDTTILHRKIFYFANDAGMLLNYIPDEKIFTFDHLVAKNGSDEGQTWLYVPDGTYDYLIFKKGKWVFKEELFDKTNFYIKEAGDSPHDVDRHGKQK